jgi:hypothetical protein
MQAPLLKLLAIALAAILALSAFDASAARKKPRVKRPPAPAVTYDYDGTPIIMKGYRSILRDAGTPSIMREEGRPKTRAERPLTRPVGSSTYIPPPVPSPNSPNSPPSPALLAPPPAVYTPPRIDSPGDRATRCLHSFPLAGGIGNNPTDRDAYVRSCAN